MNFFNKPHPFIYNKASIVLPGVITFLLIVIIAPFGFRELSIIPRFLFAAVIGGICSLSIIAIVALLRRFFPKLMNEERWTMGKEILLFVTVVFAICLNIFFVFVLFDLSSTPPLPLFVIVVVNTVSIGIFPITIVVLYEQYRHQKKQVLKANTLSRLIDRPGNSTTKMASQSQKILFSAENGKIELHLEASNILYLASGGNYVEVYYFNAQKEVQKKLVRNRLKSLAENLPQDTFFQSHRSFIVNGQHITRVDGNARNFELFIDSIHKRLPVARSKAGEVSRFLKSLQ